MRLVMDVFLSANKNNHGFARKEYETNILPYKGLEIEDSAWKKPRKIISVLVNYQDELIYVVLEEYEILDDSNLEKTKAMLISHDWKVR